MHALNLRDCPKPVTAVRDRYRTWTGGVTCSTALLLTACLVGAVLKAPLVHGSYTCSARTIRRNKPLNCTTGRACSAGRRANEQFLQPPSVVFAANTFKALRPRGFHTCLIKAFCPNGVFAAVEESFLSVGDESHDYMIGENGQADKRGIRANRSATANNYDALWLWTAKSLNLCGRKRPLRSHKNSALRRLSYELPR
ncbi:hypothetical protein Bbelb_014320 [Branchiostoma belcheri]|nr:hypothetical protein Bbelb_014320 [Branchiostoma belcheri]